MDYYLKGEERFGAVSSRLYSFGARNGLKKLYNFITNDVKRLRPKSILDVGAGPGDLSILLDKTIKNVEIYCVDPSNSMKNIAVKKFEKMNIKNIHYALGSGRYIPFKKKFDVILSSISFHHWKKKKESIEYLLSKLDSNGQLIIYEFFYDRLNVINRAAIGKHSLPLKEAKTYAFRGYKKSIRSYGNLIAMSFKTQN